MSPRSNERGFTLIELMIVVLIIGLLAAIALPKFAGATNTVKQSEAELLLKQVYTLQEMYRLHNGHYAASMAELANVGWRPPTPIQYFALPTIVSGGGPGSTVYQACMASVAEGITNRSVNQDRIFGSC